MSAYDGLSVSRDAEIATIFIEKLRIDGLLTYMLGWLFSDLEDDARVAGVIVTGRKNVFLAGADLKELGDLHSRTEALGYLEVANAAWKPVREFPKPVVMAINGYCLGGGLELALCGDLRVCVDEVRNVEGQAVAFIGFPEAALGIVPPLGGVQMLTRLVGPARAKELLFTAAPVNAARALHIGLVDRVVAAPRLLLEDKALLRAILANAEPSLREIKALVDASCFAAGLDEGLRLEREAFARCCERPDKNERIDAFRAGSAVPARRQAS